MKYIFDNLIRKAMIRIVRVQVFTLSQADSNKCFTKIQYDIQQTRGLSPVFKVVKQ